MNTPEEARWVSKQTFLELWEAHQKALTELQELSAALQESERFKAWAVSEVLRLGDLARAYSQKNDELRQHLKQSTQQTQGDN